MKNEQSELRASKAIIWIDKLAKTRVKQGKEQLGDSKLGYCCLGYGCKVLKIDYCFNAGLSKSLMLDIGLIDEAGAFEARAITIKGCIMRVNSLTDLNDSAELSFRRISTFIKKNLGELFIPSVALILMKHYKK
jgi:hypothetical protein